MNHLLLVNDGTLDLSKLIKERLIFFGERHKNEADTKTVRKIIDMVAPDFVLVEGLGDLKLTTKAKKLSASKADVSKFFYHKLTEWWIAVALDYDIPFIGFELTDRKGIDNDNLVESFKARENHWIEVIKKYTTGNSYVLVICGDTHLRTVACDALGEASPLYRAFPNAAFIRLKEPEIE